MATIDNNTILLIAVAATNAWLMYYNTEWKRKVLGGLFFIFIGMSVYLLPDVTLDYPWGILIAALGLIDLVLRLLDV